MANRIEIAEAVVPIIPSAKGINKNIEKELSGELSTAGVSGGNALGQQLVSTLKKVIVAAGIGKAIQSAMSEGAKLQQSYGGLETIYGEASKAAQEYAEQAYKAGLSANDYAEQAVSFGASLKQAFGGDTTQAVEAANMAIMDMTDNAAKMGTPIESIQHAYQGFAKQNYTMLDNLKLGYGGTKEEMERLLADAQELTGVEYNLDNLGDVYEAIHVIQGELGLTGVAAAEAEGTFSGSMGAMRAALSNFLGALATGGDITTSLQAVIGNAAVFLQNNLLPMLGNIITAIPTVIQTAVPALLEAFTGLFTQISPLLSQESINAGLEMIAGLASGVASQIPVFLAQALPMLLQFSEYIRTNIGTIVDTGIEILKGLVQGLISAFPTLIATVPQIITNIAGVINDNMPKILKAGLDIIVMLGKGIIDNIPVIIANMGNIVQAIISVVMAVNWIDLGSKILTGIINGLKAMSANVTGFFKGLISGIKDGFLGAGWGEVGRNIITGIVNGLKGAGGMIVNAAKEAAKAALMAAKNFLGIESPSKVFRDEVGAMMAEGMAVGFEDNVPVNEIESALQPMTSVVPDTFNGSQYSYGGFTINVYGAPGQDVNALADIISDRINAQIARGRAVFA